MNQAFPGIIRLFKLLSLSFALWAGYAVDANANQAPVADAGADQTVSLGSVELDGSASSDPDGDTLLYAWEIVDEPEDGVAILTGAETVRPTLHIEAPGQYVVSLRVSDGQLESPPDTVVIQTVNRPPVAVIEAPAQVDEGAEITLSGHSSYDPDHDSLTFQWSLISRPAQSQTVIEEPTLEATVFRADKPGSYTVGLTVSDGSADSDPVTAVIVAQVLENHPPKITTSPYPYGEVLSVYEYDVDAVDEDGDDLVFSVEDAPAGLTIDAATGLVHWVPSARGSYGFAVVVTDARGAVTRQYVRLNIRPSAADEPDAEPAPVPVLQPLPFPGYFDANRFLIESDPPRQKDVTAYPFADGQTAGVSGHIRDLNGYPLANVAVQVADHPEYGYTLTDGDGNYRILFPGGGQRRLRFDKTGYVPAYRGVAPDWGEDRVLGEQVLLARNPQGAEVYLNGEVSELIPVSGAGTSQGATLLFDAGDTVLPVGETIPLPPETTLFLRLTDFSQSEQKELPAPLPDTWNASNVVVLSEDEYVQGLVFGQPHPVYLPNHQQYPLGTGLYVGHFNPASGTWQEKGAGHVLKIIDKQDGQAVLSVDADGSPMDPGQLAALGITGAERAWLAEHYGIGDMVQRMPVSGTGIWAMGLALLPQAMDELPEEPPYEPGVELPPVTQQLPLEGSSYALQYSSERARGYALSSMAMIPLTGEAVSDALVKVELVARVAGREYRYDYDPEPGLEHRFLWDGLDYFGRAVNGRKRLKIEVNHYYKADYPLSASLIDEAFGDLPAGGAQTRQSGSTLKVTRQWEVWLGNYTNEYTGLGGWSLNVHHAFDPASGTLYLGDTHSRKYDYRLPHNASDGQFTPRVDLQGVLPASPQSLSIAPGASGETAVSTDRLLWHFSADGQLQSSLDVAQALGLEAQDPLQLSDLAYWHGNLLAVDKAGHRLLQLTSNGASILAAAPAEGCSDGIFCEPVALAPGTEGPLIIAARGSRKLYQWDGQGGLRAYAGSGEAGEFDQENGDGGLARHAAFGQLGKIAWDQAHNLYVADNYPGEGYRIRRISMNGYISTVLLETSPARVTGLVVDSDGTLVVGQSNCRMILLSADGVRTEVDMSSAGGCSEGLESLAIGPDGRLLAGDLSPGAVMRWESRYVTYADDAYKISDPALPEVYWFDDNGRHLRTTDSLGNNHYVFAYDADGYLQQVTNSSGADLQITRNPDGSGSQLQLSTGGTWTLTYNGQKLLIQAVKPNGDTHSWTYTLPGMLASAGDSSGALEEFYYTPYGETWPAPYSYAPTVQQDQLPSAGPSNLVASLPGEFAVTGNGAASYAVPIEIPPGRGKLTPKLTLQYNSQGGSGLLGMGWSLGGLSTIHRCKQTWAQDNKPAAVEMHADDALCLDGRRMLRVNNVAQGHVGSEYRLELDDFSVIKLLRDSSSNLMYFEVWTKSGEIMEYGRTQDSQVNTADGKIQRWALNRVIDTAQNYFDVSYFENTALGEHRVSRIDYTGNLRTGAGFHSHIDFVYEDRPDPSYGFLAQSRISSTTRLKAIRVREGSAQVRSYQFDYYATGYAAPRSRLAQIRMCMGEDNANDCVPPTLIEWHTAAHPKTDNLFSSAILSDKNKNSIGDSASRDAARVLDFNGDGIADLAYPTQEANGALAVDIYGRHGGVVSHLTYTPGMPPVEDGPWKGAPFIVMDVDGDGDSDILVPQASWQVYYDDGENQWSSWHLDGWKKLSYSGGDIVDSDQVIADTASEEGNSWGCGGIGKAPSNCMPIVLDANGDGLQDLVFPKHASTGSLFSPIQWELKLNRRNAPGQFYSAGSAGLPAFKDDDRLMVIDVNGDGMQDLFSVNNWIYFSHGNSFSGVKVGWNSPKDDKVSMVIDINGDGYQDIVWFANRTVKYRLNWGGTRIFPGRASFSPNAHAAKIHIYGESDDSILHLVTAPDKSHNDAQSANPIDWDKDGVTDILLAHKDKQRTWWVLLTRFNAAGAPYFEAINTGILTERTQNHHPQVADFDGDGFEDLIYGKDHRWELRRRIKTRSDLVHRITAGRGRFNDVIEIDYRPLTDEGMHSSYNNNGAARKGYRYIQAPMYVVSGTRQDNGIGGYHVQNFRYEGARASLRGRGFQGFAKQVTTDVTAGLTETQLFKQDFPFTGSLAEKETKRSADGRRLSLMRRPVFNKGGGSIRAKFYSPWAPKTYDYSYDLQSGSQVSLKTTELGARDVAGNFGLHKTTTWDVLRGGVTHIKTTESEYDNNATYWLFGRLKQSTVTHSGTAYPIGQSIKRKSIFSYFMNSVGGYRPTGQLKCEVIEPDNGQYKQTTCHEYDDYGNERQTAVSGYLVDRRQTDTPYDAQGRFPLKTINALGHEERYTYNSRFGFRTSLTGPNNLTTTWTPDALGRMKQETRADGTYTTVIRQWDTPGCPAIAVYRVDTVTSGQPRQYQCMDKKNRVIREAVEGFSANQWKKKDTEYDALGRVTRVSRPFFNNATYWTTTSYDILNRPMEVSSPVNGTTSYEYGVSLTPSRRGQRITTTTEVTYQTDHGPVRAPDQVNIVITNALGQKLAVRDALGNWMNFTYDATGNRTGITDTHGNHTTIAYTLRGDKLWQDDPDMGLWAYAYNGSGELIRQTDAKGQTLVMSYDALGRLRERYVEGNRANTLETWEWDKSGRGKSLGKLTGESSRHYQRAYFYDDLGRRNRTDTYIDKTLDGTILDSHGASYSESLTFDSYGRIARRLYAGGQVSLDYHYNGQGYLAYVEDAATGAVYWYGRQTNADGAFTEEIIGDLDVLHDYDPASGRVAGILTDNGAMQDLAYGYDSLGNLRWRRDRAQDIREDFDYDVLNRLTGVTTDDRVSPYRRDFSYDALGNLLSKDGLSYSYGGSGGPHAVSRTQGEAPSYIFSNGFENTPYVMAPRAGSSNYQYDNNGNMVQGGGRSYSWDAHNHLTAVYDSRNGAILAFRYGPDGQRHKQVKHFNDLDTTIHYLGDVEVYYRGDDATPEYRHYIQANGQAVAVRIIQDNQRKTRYLYRDHLGSVDVITENRALREHPSFEAWGQRRPVDWSQGQAPASEEPRGYTGHEHLDEVGLIHMNGRVYDPQLGRFLSADPFIQFADNSQSYNRYSYVLNNPLSHTDPSGHVIPVAMFFMQLAINNVSAELAASAVEGMALQGVEAAVVQTAIQAGINGLAQGLASSAMGGTFAEGFEAGVLNGVQSGIYGGIGHAESLNGTQIPGLGKGITVERVLAHGLVGGAFARARGDSFESGFASGVFSKLAAGRIQENISNKYSGAAASAMIGGTASVIAGGKFANGALSGAFGYLMSGVNNRYEDTGGLASGQKGNSKGGTVGLLKACNAGVLGACSQLDKANQHDLSITLRFIKKTYPGIMQPFGGNLPSITFTKSMKFWEKYAGVTKTFSGDIVLSSGYDSLGNLAGTLGHELLHSGDGFWGRMETRFDDIFSPIPPMGLGIRHTEIHRFGNVIERSYK